MRQNEKRLTVALDGDTYKALKLHGVEVAKSNQEMIERAIKEFLARVGAE